MKRLLTLLIISCTVATAAHAQDAKEGQSLKQRLFPTMKQDIDAINQRSAVNDKLPVTPSNKRTKEVIFTDYKPAATTAPAAATARSKSNAGTLPSDKAPVHSIDSTPAKIYIPHQGEEAPKKN
ncbi:hypothetical protein SAMN05444266_106180 [Chitinophaga jiangningensis]|uniref:Uncharacterized protein n=1 Tax=Chitinophaga jiangningensis TaxID=1419482 RepID=A0A1M7FKK7_9BACT|nr:hypothetical protein [Chitinophaga jiangningensis]SHM04601.1 hypothetical protein SAMN05444266_106180 [Chitinophaga jiangningensis]